MSVKFSLNQDDEIDFKMNGLTFEIWIETINSKDKIVIRASDGPVTHTLAINPINRDQIEVF